MPKTLWITKALRSGVSITWTKSCKRIDVSGWYDGNIGIPNQSFTLREFLESLGIQKQDCDKAFAEETHDKRES